MTERPIIFSGPMVGAILSGAKSQTRRLVRIPDGVSATNVGFSAFTPEGKISVRGRGGADEVMGEWFVANPYGKSGDQLYVREAFRAASINHNIPAAQFFDIQYREGFGIRGNMADGFAAELASRETKWEISGTGNRWGRWRPSIHMPKWASRITLEVTGVRSGRLQDITEEDAYAEGIVGTLPEDTAVSARHEFEILWDKLNLKRAPWASNPWVFVVEFRRIDA